MTKRSVAGRPHKTGLLTAARKLVRELRVRPESLDAFMQRARDYNNLEDDFQYRLEYADYLGEEHDAMDVSDVRAALDRAADLLLTYEQDPALRFEATEKVLREIGEEPGDHEIFTVAVLVDLLSFTGPQDRLLTLLTRSLAGQTFIDQTVLFDGPRWFARWVDYLNRTTVRESVHVLETLEATGDPAVLAAATVLWEPLHGDGSFKSPRDAIASAKRLA